MAETIDITPIGNTPVQSGSAGRISALLESAFLDSAWVQQCEGDLAVSQFSEHTDRVIVKGMFSGRSNGHEFSIPFERDYLIGNQPSASALLQNPVFAIIATAAQTACNEQDPKTNAENWRVRSEIEIASNLEQKINKLIGAPLEGIRSIWRYSQITGITLFVFATIGASFFAYTHPHPRHLDDGFWGRLVISLMCGALFAGVPTGLAGVFFGLSCIGRDVDESIAVQSLLRFVGVKNAKALRVVSVGGAMFCLAGAGYFMRLLFFRG